MYRNLVGDPMYNRNLAAGDPIFGALVPFAGAAARKLAPKLLRGAGGLIRRIRGLPRGVKTAGGLVGAGAAYEIGARGVRRAFGGRGGEAGGGGGRRMNVANARALRRALRRVAGFGKLVQRSKKQVSRAYSAMGLKRGTRAKTPFKRR